MRHRGAGSRSRSPSPLPGKLRRSGTGAPDGSAARRADDFRPARRRPFKVDSDSDEEEHVRKQAAARRARDDGCNDGDSDECDEAAATPRPYYRRRLFWIIFLNAAFSSAFVRCSHSARCGSSPPAPRGSPLAELPALPCGGHAGG
jgi:hypothetical protein